MPSDQRESMEKQVRRIDRAIPAMEVQSMDENNFSITRDDFPRDIVNIGLRDGIVTYVHRDGRVQMKFLRRVTPREKREIDELQDEIKCGKQQIYQDASPSERDLSQNFRRVTL